MTTLPEVERLALALSEEERVMLVNRLLDSLPPGMDELDGGEGIAEALRRDAEFAADPSTGITLEEFDAFLRQRRGAA